MLEIDTYVLQKVSYLQMLRVKETIFCYSANRLRWQADPEHTMLYEHDEMLFDPNCNILQVDGEYGQVDQLKMYTNALVHE